MAPVALPRLEPAADPPSAAPTASRGPRRSGASKTMPGANCAAACAQGGASHEGPSPAWFSLKTRTNAGSCSLNTLWTSASVRWPNTSFCSKAMLGTEGTAGSTFSLKSRRTWCSKPFSFGKRATAMRTKLSRKCLNMSLLVEVWMSASLTFGWVSASPPSGRQNIDLVCTSGPPACSFATTAAGTKSVAARCGNFTNDAWCKLSPDGETGKASAVFAFILPLEASPSGCSSSESWEPLDRLELLELELLGIALASSLGWSFLGLGSNLLSSPTVFAVRIHLLWGIDGRRSLIASLGDDMCRGVSGRTPSRSACAVSR
mmetsp:Transcript_36195/g.103969  ORF Transcript_36195/g.103969 Transcript_36195/m.103969 type:complete len:318 (+) Transcript_36195:1583-2536(+)